MLKLILSTFIMIMTTFSSFAKIDEIEHVDEKTKICVEHVEKNSLDQEKHDCNDCEGDGCDKRGSCCRTLCPCLSALTVPFHKSTNSISESIISKLDWYYFNQYKSPVLDPALKPPLFS